jgi:hypothetical protein
MPIDAVAQIARDILLKLNPELAGEPDEGILQHDRHQQHDDDVAQRDHRVRGVDQVPDGAPEKVGDPAALDRKRIGAEQRVEEGDEQRERESIERGGDDAGENRPRHAPPVRAQEGEQPSIHFLARHERLPARREQRDGQDHLLRRRAAM